MEVASSTSPATPSQSHSNDRQDDSSTDNNPAPQETESYPEIPVDIPLGTIASPIQQEHGETASTFQSQSVQQSPSSPSTQQPQSIDSSSSINKNSSSNGFKAQDTGREEASLTEEAQDGDEDHGDLSFSPTHSRQTSLSNRNSLSLKQASMNGIHSALEAVQESSIPFGNGVGERELAGSNSIGEDQLIAQERLELGEDMGDMGAAGFASSGEEEEEKQEQVNGAAEAFPQPPSSPIPPGIVVHQASPTKTRNSRSDSRYSVGSVEFFKPGDEDRQERMMEETEMARPSGLSEELSDASRPASSNEFSTEQKEEEQVPQKSTRTYTRPAKVSHGRIDSLPPQKYEIPPALPLKVSPYSLSKDVTLEEEAEEQSPNGYGRTRNLSSAAFPSSPSRQRERTRTNSASSPSNETDLRIGHVSSSFRTRSASNASDSTSSSDGGLTGEAERAGLDFEEVGLDLDGSRTDTETIPDPNLLASRGPHSSPRRRSTSPSATIRSASVSPRKGTSPYGPNAASFSRSSVEIRSDSIASGSKAAKKISKAARQKAEEEEKRRIEKELRDGWKLRRLSAHSGNGDSPEDGDERRSVEGRYRGRTSSAGGSRATSPEPPSSPGLNPGTFDAGFQFASNQKNVAFQQQHPTDEVPSESQFARGWANDQETEDQKRNEREEELRREAEEEIRRAGVGMVVAGEDGELEVVGSENQMEEGQGAEEDVKVGQQDPSNARDSVATSRSGTTKESERSRASTSSSAAAAVSRSQTASESNDSASASNHPAFKSSLSSSQPQGSPSTPTSPILTDAADKPRTKHSRKPSKGPSALEQHISKTRMAHLPPKGKTEESKHLNSFESMMKQSKLLEHKRQEEENLARLERENELNERTKRWEKEILPNWNRSRKDANLKSLWKLGCPPSLRGRVWIMASGNAQMLPRGLLTQARGVKEEKRKEMLEAHKADGGSGVEENLEPICQEDRKSIEEDIAQTLPTLKLFQKDIGPLYDDLKDVLEGLVMVRYDQLSTSTPNPTSINSSPSLGSSEAEFDANSIQAPVYQKGLASLAATLLCNLSPQETLIALMNLIEERPWLKTIYSLNHAKKQKADIQKWIDSNVKGKTGSVSKTFSLFSSSKSNQDSDTKLPNQSLSIQGLSTQAIEATNPARTASFLKSTKGHERVFSTLLADRMPKVYANLGHNNVDIGEYVRSWVGELFTRVVSLDCASRIWDLM